MANARRVIELVPLTKLRNEFPDLIIFGVEDMRSIHVDVNAFDLPRKRIPGDVIPAVNDQALFAVVGHRACKGSAERSGSDDQIVIFCSSVFCLHVPPFCVDDPVSSRRPPCYRLNQSVNDFSFALAR